MKIAVEKILANPYRNVKHYPIDNAKVNTLVLSINDTGFWDNVLLREAPDRAGHYEMAYGHHRLVALKKTNITHIDVPVKKITNTDMAKILARENMVEWTHNASMEQETVRVVIEAYGKGEIEFEVPSNKTNKEHFRYAPNFAPSTDAQGRPGASDYPYTVATLGKFLGWIVKKNDGGESGRYKVEAALNALTLIEKNIVPKETFTALSTEQARHVTAETNRALRETKEPKQAAKVAAGLAAGFRVSSSKPRTPADGNGSHPKVTIHNAKHEADRILGRDRKPAPKNLDQHVDSFLKGLAGVFVKRSSALRAIVEYRDDLPDHLKRRLLGAAKSIRKEMDTFIAKIEGEGTDNYRVSERVLALTDQSEG